MKKRILTFLMLLLATTCFAQIIEVDKDGPARVHTIQEGINLASDNDTVIVHPGTYSMENISFEGKKIKIQSSDPNDWEVIKSTIIHQSYVNFTNSETNDSILEGFTITLGDGIHCENSSPTIRKCNITGNRPYYYEWTEYPYPHQEIIYEPGGGIRLINDCNAIIENCIISGNYGSRGSGVYIRAQNYLTANSKFINCTITNNSIYLNEEDYNYEIDPNWLKYQVDCTCARTEFINCIIFSGNYDFYGCDSSYTRSLFIADPALVKNSCVNLAYMSTGYYTPYSNGDYYSPDAPMLDLTTVNNNISQDPQFINPLRLFVQEDPPYGTITYFDGDYHLKPTSPCIDAGTSEGIYPGQKDGDGDNLGIAHIVDIGADEFAPTLTLLYPATDDVWIAGSKHIIGWTDAIAVREIDIFFSDSNGQSWSLIADGQSPANPYLWTLPTDANSQNCFIKIELNNDPNTKSIISERFSIRPALTPTPPSQPHWPMLGGNQKHTAQSNHPGPTAANIKCYAQLSAGICDGLTVDSQGYIQVACKDGMLYSIEMNPQSVTEIPDSSKQSTLPLMIATHNFGKDIYATPAIRSDGGFYLPCKDGTVIALNSDYQFLWQNKLDSQINASPTVDVNDNAYIGTDSGRIYSISADGSVNWYFDKKTQGPQSAAVFASPSVAEDGTVYVARMRDPNLYALNPNDGSIKWTHTFSGTSAYNQSWPISSPVIADDGTIYLAMAFDPNLYAINPTDGSLKWSTNLCQPPHGNETLFDQYVNETTYYGNTTGNYIGDGCFSEMAVADDGTIYVNFNDPFLRAIDPNGEILWAKRLGMNGGFDFVIDSQGLIFAACEDKYLSVVDPQGAEVARFKHDFALSDPVISYPGVVIVADANNSIISLSLSDPNMPLVLHHPADLNADKIINFKDLGHLYNMIFKSTDPGWKRPGVGPVYGQTIYEHYYNFLYNPNAFTVRGYYPNQYIGDLQKPYKWFYYDEFNDYSEDISEYKIQQQYLQNDINRDWYIDMFDFFTIADNWLYEN